MGQAEHPGLPQAAARRICGHGSHPLQKERQITTRKLPVAAVPPLCAGFGVEVKAVLLKRGFRRRWAACGAAAVQGSHDAAILAIQNIQFQKKNASGESRFGFSGGVRF